MSGTNNKGKVFVGLSGGVDSAVSAALLREQGYDVTGVFIRIAIPGYPCTAGEDKIDAQRVAAHLRIPFIEIDLSKEYREEVFNATVDEFGKGNTPNPDTLCNQKIKFGAFFAFAKAKGADFIATGHYARVGSPAPLSFGRSGPLGQVLPSLQEERGNSGNISLLKGADNEKDQSYFLWSVPETALRYTLFPVGTLRKPQVRALAEKFGLPNARRKDSQGLCFLGDISIEDMLKKELAPAPGEVLSESGAVVGAHRGAVTYTLGQRHGFELFEQTGVPHYVVGKDQKNNTITVSTSPFPRGVSKTRLVLSNTNWIGEAADGEYQARFRYRQKLIPARLHRSGNSAEVILQEPHYAPAGQSLVLYEGDPLRLSEARRCIGGGIIKEVHLT